MGLIPDIELSGASGFLVVIFLVGAVGLYVLTATTGGFGLGLLLLVLVVLVLYALIARGAKRLRGEL